MYFKYLKRVLLVLFVCLFGVSSYGDGSGAVAGASGSGLSGMSGVSAGVGSSMANQEAMVPAIDGSAGVDKQQDTSVDLNAAAEADKQQSDADSSDDGSDADDSDANSLSKGKGSAVKQSSGVSAVDPFANNVFIRTGVRLKRYSANTFKSPKSFTPMQNMPIPSNYIIGPGDSINVHSWGTVKANINSKVKPDGTIFVPNLGDVSVTGVKEGELGSYMKGQLGKIYRGFELSANVSKIRTIQVLVAGMANKPGTYYLSSLATLSNAIFAVGGPSSQGSMRDIELRRSGVLIAHFDAYDLLINGSMGRDVPLLAGDVIMFKPLGNQAAIYDGVKRPAIYEMKPKETIADIINFAGGYSSDAKTDKIIIETINKDQLINVHDYSTTTALSMPISDGEVIHFFRTQNRYESSIAVIGNIAYPTRVGYKEGMKVNDVIPNKDVLLTASYYNSYSYNTYGRDNTMTQIGMEKTTNQSGSGGLNLTTGLQSTSNLSNSKPIFGGGQNLFIAGPVSIPQADINWNYALIVRVDNSNFSTHIIPFNLRKAIAGDSENNLVLQPGDVINVLSAKDVRSSDYGAPTYVFIDGEVNYPGVYELKYGQTLKDVVNTAGGVTPKSYLFGMELTRQSVKQQQAVVLGQMLDQAQQSLLANAGSISASVTADQAKTQQMAIQQQLAFINQMRRIKPSGRIILGVKSDIGSAEDLPDFQLENGDTVYIPSRPNIVHVVGQVYNPATFMYNPKTTVRGYIDLAGTENKFADASSEYILRADGSLYSKQQAGWFGTFGSRNLNPGDVVIVPQDIDTSNVLLATMNITQILANSAQVVALFAGKF